MNVQRKSQTLEDNVVEQGNKLQLSQHMPRMPQKNNRLRMDKGETQKTKHDEDGDGNGDGDGGTTQSICRMCDLCCVLCGSCVAQPLCNSIRK